MTESVAAVRRAHRHAFDEPVLAGAAPHRVKVSIGAAVYPAGGRTADELLSNSHLAFYRAKATGAAAMWCSRVRSARSWRRA